MALAVEDRLVEFLARVDRADGRVVGMHIIKERLVTDGSTIVSSTLLPAEEVTWAGLVALMHPDDIAALVATMAPP
jgi:hypothetical protein